jgi:integrase
VPSLVTEFLEARQKGGAGQRHYSDLKSRLGQFAREFDGQLSAVTSRKITDWLDRRNLAPKSWNNFVNALGSLFIYAVSNRCLAAEHNPIKGVSKKKDVGGEIEVFTPGEIALLLQHATPDLLPVLAIGAFTGIRSAEIDRLEWSEVKFDTGFIVVGAGKAKTAARRVIPMPANLQAWLQPYQKLTGKVWPHSLDYRYGAMEKVTKASGVPWKQNALRHSYISYRLAETRDVNKVALEAGNSPAMIHGHYKALVTPVEAKAWFAVMPEMPANVTTMPTAAAVKVGARYCDGHVSQP